MKQSGVLKHQSWKRTLWNEEGLASSYSCINESASCGVSPVRIFFNEPKQHFTCSMHSSYIMDWMVVP
jgi:hypothetical protein